MSAMVDEGEADERVERVRAELARAPDADARLAILVRAVEEHPDVGEVRWMLYQHYVGIGEHDAAQRQLARGLARGEREFVLEQARSYPESLEGAAFEAIVREDPVLAAACELARGEIASGRARLGRVVEDSGAAYRGRALPRDAWLDVIAIALEREATDVARWMLDVLRAGAVRFETKSDARHDGEALVRLESGLRELLDVPAHIPRAYRAALARALRATTSEASTDAIHAVRRDGADDGAQVYRDLAKSAPELASRFRRALVGKVALRSDGRPGQSRWQPLRWFVMSVMLLFLAARAACSPSENDMRRRATEAEMRERHGAARGDRGERAADDRR